MNTRRGLRRLCHKRISLIGPRRREKRRGAKAASKAQSKSGDFLISGFFAHRKRDNRQRWKIGAFQKEEGEINPSWRHFARFVVSDKDGKRCSRDVSF